MSGFRTQSGRPAAAALSALVTSAPDAARAANLAVGLVLEAAIKGELSTPGQGREYPRGTRTHRASAPGDPPAPDTGNLRASVGTSVEEGGAVRVGTNAEYAEPLEFGTPTIEPRPFMRPALASVETALGREVATVLRRTARADTGGAGASRGTR